MIPVFKVGQRVVYNLQEGLEPGTVIEVDEFNLLYTVKWDDIGIIRHPEVDLNFASAEETFEDYLERVE